MSFLSDLLSLSLCSKIATVGAQLWSHLRNAYMTAVLVPLFFSPVSLGMPFEGCVRVFETTTSVYALVLDLWKVSEKNKKSVFRKVSFLKEIPTVSWKIY